MNGAYKPILLLASLLLIIPSASAYVSGTSSISLSQGAINISTGGTGTVGYTVNLATGSTWGTNLQINNQQQLSSSGITLSPSKSSGDPPYSGTLSIGVSQAAAPGTYRVVLSAAGDDPSMSNATLVLNVQSPASTQPTTVSQQNASGATSTAPPQPTTSQPNAPTTSIYQPQSTAGYGAPPYGSSSGGLGIMAGALILIIVLATAALCAIRKPANTRLIFIGTALILVGIVAWLYGDYSATMNYVYAGLAAGIIGILVWVAGDARAGMFASTKARGAKLTILGIILLAIGILLWLYADFYALGNTAYVWGGVALMVAGVIVWLYGDGAAGAFKAKK